MDPYYQHQQQLMAAAFGLGGGINGMNMVVGGGGGMNGMYGMNGLTTPLLETVFGHPPAPRIMPPMPLMPLPRRGAHDAIPFHAPPLPVRQRAQPKPGHTAKKDDGKSTGPWSNKEHQMFEKAVIIYGWGNWVQVTNKIPGRTKDQCKSHAQKFAKHHPAERARLDREHDAYRLLQSQQRYNNNRSRMSRNNERETIPIVHPNSDTQSECLPTPSQISDSATALNDDHPVDDMAEKNLPSLPPQPKHSVKVATPVKKKVVVKPKLPTRTAPKLPLRKNASKSPTGAMAEGSQKITPVRESDDRHTEKVQHQQPPSREETVQELIRITPAALTAALACDEPLPAQNTVTPPKVHEVSKSREPKVLHVPSVVVGSVQKSETREIENQLAMDTSLTTNVDTTSREEKSPEQTHPELKVKATGSVTTFSTTTQPIIKVDEPPLVHTPHGDFDPESIDTICAQIYERKQQNGCSKFPLCLCNQTPCAKKSLTSSLRLKKSSHHEML